MRVVTVEDCMGGVFMNRVFAPKLHLLLCYMLPGSYYLASFFFSLFGRDEHLLVKCSM